MNELKLTPELSDFLLNAESKAIATTGQHGVNVVPFSTIKIVNSEIILVDYFFQKTSDNLKENKNVSITAWSGLSGYQIKAAAEYHHSGKLFKEIVDWIGNNYPERTISGIISLTPNEIYDISIPTLS